MKAITHDPLLAVAKGVLIFLMVVVAIAGGACAAAIPVVIFSADVVVQLAEEIPTVPTATMITAIAVTLAFAALLLAALFRVFQLLYSIVETVAEGDPFVPDNAKRLTQTAWLALGVQIVSMPLEALGNWIGDNADKTEGGSDIALGISGNGLLLVLILFILARVFRKGTEMRAELEGMV